MLRPRSRRRREPLPLYDARSKRAGLRLSRLADDFWELRNGEESAREHPDTFEMPPRELRENLRRLDLVQLIFDIEGENEAGDVEVAGERMWVLVAERVGAKYIGVLSSKPALLDPSEGFYLRRGCEVYFGPEHVVRVEAAEARRRAIRHLEREPTLRWPYVE